MGAKRVSEAPSTLTDSARQPGLHTDAVSATRLVTGTPETDMERGEGDAALRLSPDRVRHWPPEPTVIGATGGSGTRVIARILRRAGVFMGSQLNRAEDSIPLAMFCNRWVNDYTTRAELVDEHEAQRLEAAMVRSFGEALEDHWGRPEAVFRSWGWKAPTSMYLLPFFHRHFPRLRFVHLVRDGRDMAFSKNENQLRKHGSLYLSEEQQHLSRPEQLITLWSHANLAVVDYGERELGDRYLRVRFEDLCADPMTVVGHLLDFAGLDTNLQDIVPLEIEPPASLGRWREQDDRILRDLHRIGEVPLRRFGYLPQTPTR